MFGNNLKDEEGFTIYDRDALDIDPNWLEGADAIIHLAGLSNDPMANFRPRDNYIYNSALSSLLVFLCKQKRIKRFIFGSSCSIYGFSTTQKMNEESPLSPSFPYGLSKMQAEYALNSSADENFKPIIFRQATVHGWAPRMRFDLVVNTMTKYGVCYGKITVTNPKLWRPLIHIRDLVEAYILALKAPEGVSGAFNIAGDNYTVLNIAEEVQSALAANGFKCDLDILNVDEPRSYQVENEKAESVLGFKAKIGIRESVEELLKYMENKSQAEWENPWYINAEVYRKKILGEEKNYRLWKDFISNFKNEFDHLNFKDWPQEGP